MSSIHIPRQQSSQSLTASITPNPSAPSSPSASPTTEHQDRMNALLATFEAGTHAFCREEWTDGVRMSKPIEPKVTSGSVASTSTSSATQPRRPFLSLLSLSRPSSQPQQRHFDPSREPKLHGLP